jgi:transposase
MVSKGRGLVGEKNANTKFTEADILRIYELVDQGKSRKQIAEIFNVAAETISHIATGRNWKHLYERHRASDSM